MVATKVSQNKCSKAPSEMKLSFSNPHLIKTLNKYKTKALLQYFDTFNMAHLIPISTPVKYLQFIDKKSNLNHYLKSLPNSLVVVLAIILLPRPYPSNGLLSYSVPKEADLNRYVFWVPVLSITGRSKGRERLAYFLPAPSFLQATSHDSCVPLPPLLLSGTSSTSLTRF